MDKGIEDKEQDIWNQLRNSLYDIGLGEAWEAHEENLQLILDEVEPPVNSWSRKSVITADHGNLVGERLSPIPTCRKFDHPYRAHAEPLPKIPRLVVDSLERREVTNAPPPLDTEGVSGEEITNRLEALEYR